MVRESAPRITPSAKVMAIMDVPRLERLGFGLLRFEMEVEVEVEEVWNFESRVRGDGWELIRTLLRRFSGGSYRRGCHLGSGGRVLALAFTRGEESFREAMGLWYNVPSFSVPVVSGAIV